MVTLENSVYSVEGELAEVRAKIKELRDELRELEKRRHRLEVMRNEPVSGTTGGADIELVPIHEVQPYVQRYIENGNKVIELAQAAKLNTRTVRRVKNGQSDRGFINFGTAEQLFLAMNYELPEDLTIVPLKEYRRSATMNGSRPTGRSRTK